MKQILLNFTQFSIFFKRSFLVSIFLLVFGSIFGQNAIVGSGFSTGWGEEVVQQEMEILNF